MIRILQIVNSLDMGGIQAFLMNVYRHIDRNNIQFDFLIFRGHHQIFENEINALGGKIYKLPSRHEGILKNKRALQDFFKTHPEYKTIYFHTSALNDIEPIQAAFSAGVPVRIIHSHNTKIGGNPFNRYLHQWNKRVIGKIATHYFACGELAGQWMFTGTGCESKVVIVNNGVDVESFSYNENVRNTMRKKLSLEGKYVLGHVGRFGEAKNHTFLIDIFYAVYKRRQDVVLVLVGDGKGRLEIEEKVKKLGIQDNVIFLGVRKDVPTLLQAMDVLVLPSLFEGFPVTAVEAQASGMPCVLSDAISSEVVIKDNVKMVSLNDSLDTWVDAIFSNRERIVDNKKLIGAGFDIQTTVKQLTKVYTQKVKNDANRNNC